VKVKEVPQDQDPTLEGIRKLCYAVNEQGKFEAVQTSGWRPEEIVKSIAWDNIERDLEDTRIKIRAGLKSPLAYHMKVRQMDAKLLAQNMGICSWRVRWHLTPKGFSRLSPELLSRYAQCLDLSVEALRDA
jgi:hypothetical protein